MRRRKRTRPLWVERQAREAAWRAAERREREESEAEPRSSAESARQAPEPVPSPAERVDAEPEPSQAASEAPRRHGGDPDRRQHSEPPPGWPGTGGGVDRMRW
jgi:hypothetical protein